MVQEGLVCFLCRRRIFTALLYSVFPCLTTTHDKFHPLRRSICSCFYACPIAAALRLLTPSHQWHVKAQSSDFSPTSAGS